jgi:putative transposase
MTAGLKRFYGRGDLHFITFSCYRRLPLLKTVRARDAFLEELGRVRDEMGFRLLGYVVMPEHVHLLMSEPKQGTPSNVLQKLKLRVARRLRKGKETQDPGSKSEPGAPAVGPMRSAFGDAGEPLRAFWQARFYDFNVCSPGKKKEKLNYMHANPVIRGLVEHPRDWAWSSWGFYYGEGGLLAIDLEEQGRTPRPRFKRRTWAPSVLVLVRAEDYGQLYPSHPPAGGEGERGEVGGSID